MPLSTSPWLKSRNWKGPHLPNPCRLARATRVLSIARGTGQPPASRKSRARARGATPVQDHRHRPPLNHDFGWLGARRLLEADVDGKRPPSLLRIANGARRTLDIRHQAAGAAARLV